MERKGKKLPTNTTIENWTYLFVVISFVVDNNQYVVYQKNCTSNNNTTITIIIKTIGVLIAIQGKRKYNTHHERYDGSE